MTIALRTAGTALGATVAVTAVNPAVPTGTAATDISVLTVTVKPYNATITTPTDWVKIGEATNGTTATGTDTGSTKVALYTRIGAPVGAIGAIGQTSANTMTAIINSYSGTFGAWDVTSFTSGGDTVNDANFSATGGTWPSAVVSGDWVVQGTAVNGDIGTPSAMAIGGMSGATLGTYVNRSNVAVTTGNDHRLLAGDIPITASSSTAAPTFTYTNASSQSGTTMWLRLREASLPKLETVTDDFTSADGVAWNGYGADITIVSGQLDIAAGPAYPSLYHDGRYDLTGSYFLAEITQVPNASNGSTGGAMYIQVSTGNSVAFWCNGGLMQCRETVATVDDQDAGTTYNATNHRWWRIREASGSLFWEVSTTGAAGTWTTLRTKTTTLTLTSVDIYFTAGNWNAAPTPGSIRFDNMNLPPVSLPPDSLRIWQAVNRASTY